MQVKQEGEKMYMTLFAKAARVKELTKKNESLEAICTMKVCASAFLAEFLFTMSTGPNDLQSETPH
jgi:hypothetical protein